MGFCDIREANGAYILGQQDVTGSGSGGGGTVTQGAGSGVPGGGWTAQLSTGTAFYSALTDAELRAVPVAVSAATLPLPTGAATSAAQTDGTQRAKITDGTHNVAVAAAAPVGTDQALVVRNIPSGTQTVTQGTAAATASAWPIKITDGTQTVTLINTLPGGTEYAQPVRPSLVVASTSSITAATVSTTFSSVLSANSSAKFRSFYNPSGSAIGLRLGSAGISGEPPGMLLAPRQTWVMPQASDGRVVWTGSVFGQSTTPGTLTLVVTEIT